ncbi:MAG: sensor histidine kinase [Clostridia bacterium]
MKRIKESGLLKVICYIFIPIIVLILLMSAVYLSYQRQNQYNMHVKDYYQTETFASQYYSVLQNIYHYLIQPIQEEDSEEITYYYSYFYDYSLIKDAGEKVYYQNGGRMGNTTKYYDYVIIDKQENTIYTNMRNENYQEEIENLKQQPYHWYYEGNSIQTDMQKMTEQNLKYDYSLETIERLKNDRFTIYIAFDQNKLESGNDIYMQKVFYDSMLTLENVPMYIIPICVILLLAIGVYLIWSIGHQKGIEGIALNSLDKLPYEIIGIIVFLMLFFVMLIANVLETITPNFLILSFWAIDYFVAYIICAVIGVTTIKRMKAKTFFKELWISKMLRAFGRQWKQIKKAFRENPATTKKVIILYWAFIIISSILIAMQGSFFMFLVLIGFWIWCFYKVLKYMKHLAHIKESLKEIYEGKENVVIASEDLEKSLKEMAEYINDIARGFSNAIEKSLKSERMKTELITNVSHDIKTPLTSIINYVDLLKKEEMPNDRAREYLEVLDNKSQRLKRLTEDLVEASKASSGNIKLNIEKLNVKELMKQISGEFEDKFQERKLELNLTMPEEDCIIEADSRYVYRVIENMYANVVKYALEASRVYVDIVPVENELQIQIKNISKERLNITADELMQRFVRGDSSRNTEGSGLGLSIAQSLTELQGGKFSIYLDGDLFKVIIQFKKQ